MIRLSRVYSQSVEDKGARYLVDRLWPRGVRKSDLRLDGWLKEIAPSDGLRRWYGHDPQRWDEFRRRYFAELDGNGKALEPLLSAARSGAVTLLYGAQDEEHNNAVALKEYLENKIGSGRPKRRAAGS